MCKIRIKTMNKYWDSGYASYVFERLSESDQTRKLIEEYIPDVNEGESAFEIGCFPGRFLFEIGKKGYKLNGCDLTPRIEKDLTEWFKKNKLLVGNFENSNYLNFIKNKYNLVASFGFIEHFENYKEVFLQQTEMVESGGFLLVQFPNFKGVVQKKLHSFFDIDNLNNHVNDSMDLNTYQKLLSKDFELVYCSYYGNFDFWIDDFQHKNERVKRNLLRIFFKTKKFWNYLPNHRCYSPYAAIIARKK
jgi:SAM-dependent methyltransferase